MIDLDFTFSSDPRYGIHKDGKMLMVLATHGIEINTWEVKPLEPNLICSNKKLTLGSYQIDQSGYLFYKRTLAIPVLEPAISLEDFSISAAAIKHISENPRKWPEWAAEYKEVFNEHQHARIVMKGIKTYHETERFFVARLDPNTGRPVFSGSLYPHESKADAQFEIDRLIKKMGEDTKFGIYSESTIHKFDVEISNRR